MYPTDVSYDRYYKHSVSELYYVSTRFLIDVDLAMIMFGYVIAKCN